MQSNDEGETKMVEKQRENVSDATLKPAISIVGLKVIMSLASLGVIIVGFILYKQSEDIVAFFEAFQPWVHSYVTLFCAYIGGKFVYERGRESKTGGTKYYPSKYGKRKLGEMIDKYNENYDDETYNKAELFVSAIANRQHDDYLNMVYTLQLDADFKKVWNDFNYYYGMDEKRREDNPYFRSVRKYIYLHVYNKYGKNNVHASK